MMHNMESFEDRFEKIEHYENEKDKLLKVGSVNLLIAV